MSSNKSIKEQVDEESMFVCIGHRSSLASSGEGGRAKERCNLKCDHLMPLFNLKSSQNNTLNITSSLSAAVY